MFDDLQFPDFILGKAISARAPQGVCSKLFLFPSTHMGASDFEGVHLRFSAVKSQCISVRHRIAFHEKDDKLVQVVIMP